MHSTDSSHELLLRHLDSRLTPDERLRVGELLRADGEARAFLREVAEQAVMLADLERIAAGRREELGSRATLPLANSASIKIASPRFRRWSRSVAAAAVVVLLVVLSIQVMAKSKPVILRVSKVTGSNQYFGSNGKTENALNIGSSLVAGDTLETRSCDAWLELELRDGSTMTIAGHSTLRIQSEEQGETRFHLLQGNLWVIPAQRSTGVSTIIQTPTAMVETRDAQLDIQTSQTESIARVNRGSARLTRTLDGSEVDVPAGHQAGVSLNKNEPLAVVPQPKPVDRWACNLEQVPEVILGKWLPPTELERARLGTAPLLWPVSKHDSVMLYAVALAAWKISERPVLLHSDSRLRFRGRTESPHTVRFGFSAQRMRGVFAGKFELDVKPDSLGPAGATWEVDLPLSSFRPLHPQLTTSPEGLELTDVYALTIKEDAGLEINGIELIQGPDSESGQLPNRSTPGN